MVKAHRAYRHKRRRATKTLTIRDCQAMYNFSEEGISLTTIAEHFKCSYDFVYEQAKYRPYLTSHSKPRDLGETTEDDGRLWWESTHSDPLELVKLYYPHCLRYISPNATLEITAKEMKRDEYDWNAFYTEEYGADYALLPEETRHELIEWAESLEENEQPILSFG